MAMILENAVTGDGSIIWSVYGTGQRTEMISYQYSIGPNPAEIKLKVWNETAYGGLVAFDVNEEVTASFGNINFIGRIKSAENSLDGIVYTAQDLRCIIHTSTVYRAYNVQKPSSPIGNIYSDTSLISYNFEQKLSVEDFINDISNNIIYTLPSLTITFYIDSPAGKLFPQMDFGWITVGDLLDQVCQRMGWQFTINGTELIVFDPKNTAFVGDYLPPDDRILNKLERTRSAKGLSGIQCIGDRELIETSQEAEYWDEEGFIGGTYYNITSETGECTKETLTSIADCDCEGLLTLKGWFYDKRFDPDCIVGIRPKSIRPSLIQGSGTVGTDTWFCESDLYQFNEFLLSNPQLQVKVKIHRKHWKTYEEYGSLKMKEPDMKLVYYKNSDYDSDLPQTNGNMKWQGWPRMINPVLNASVDANAQYIIDTAEDLMEEQDIYIQPVKIDLQKGIVYLKVEDLMTIKSVTEQLGTGRNVLPDAEDKVDQSFQPQTTEYDKLWIDFGLIDESSITITYCYKDEFIKGTSGDGSFILKVPNSTKFEGWNTDGAVGIDNYPDGKRDDQPSLQALADALLENDTIYDTIYNLSGLAVAPNPGLQLSVKEMTFDFTEQQALITKSTQQIVSIPQIDDVFKTKTVSYDDLMKFAKSQKEMLEVASLDMFEGAKYSRTTDVAKGIDSSAKLIKTEYTRGKIGSYAQTGEDGQKQIVKGNRTKTGTDRNCRKDENVGSLKSEDSLKAVGYKTTRANGIDVALEYHSIANPIPRHLVNIPIDDEKAYVTCGIHQHLSEAKQEPEKSGENWQTGLNIENALLCPGVAPKNWATQANRSGLTDGEILGTHCTNLTYYPVRDSNGDIVSGQYFTNSGVKVDIVSNPGAEQKAPLRIIYFDTNDDSDYEKVGYYQKLIP